MLDSQSMASQALSLWFALAATAIASPSAQSEEDSSLVAAWKEGTPLLSAKAHRFHLLDFPRSCCLAPPPRALTLDTRTGKVLALSSFSVTDDSKPMRTRIQTIHNEGGLRSLIPIDSLERFHPVTSQTVGFRFFLRFLRFSMPQGGAFETRPSPLDTFPLPGHCCDPGGSDATPCRVVANQWKLWVDLPTRRGVLRSGYQTQADACDVLDRFHVVDWGASVDDSIRHLSIPNQVFEHGYAGWDLETRRIHVASWPNIGGGYPDQEHLVIDARMGKRLQTLPAPWSGIDVESPGSDSVKAMRQRADAGFSGLKLVTTPCWESVRRISSKSGLVLQGIQNGKCMRIELALPKRIKVYPSCCDRTSDQPTKPCRIPANDWEFWPAPLGRSGLLRAQASSMANDCNGGPVYSIETWSPATCSDEDFLDP